MEVIKLSKEIKKTEYLGLRLTPELNQQITEFIDLKETEIGVRLKKTQAAEVLIQEGLKNFKNKT